MGRCATGLRERFRTFDHASDVRLRLPANRPCALSRRARGFTLIELVMVILLLGVMATFSSQFIGIGTQIYGDASRREQLMSDARFAMERLNRELRDAVPGSVRVEDVGGALVDQGTCLRFWPIATASRYLGSAISSGLTIVVPNTLPTEDKDWGIVYPLPDTTPGNLNTLDKICIDGNCAAKVSGVGNAVSGVLPLTMAGSFSKDSPGLRVYFANQQVRYCVMGTQLTRDSAGIGKNFDDPPAPVLMAEHIHPAAYYFYRDPAAFSPSEVGLRLVFEQRGESVSFNHKLEVLNVP